MKTISFLTAIITFGLFWSCSTSNKEITIDDIRTFELQYINAGLSGQIIKKDELEFNEFLRFSPDSTFVKQRVYPDSTSIVSGRYSIIQLEDREYYEVVYEEESYLIQGCGKSFNEHITILSNNKIFNGSSMPCDGAGFGYSLVD